MRRVTPALDPITYVGTECRFVTKMTDPALHVMMSKPRTWRTLPSRLIQQRDRTLNDHLGSSLKVRYRGSRAIATIIIAPLKCPIRSGHPVSRLITAGHVHDVLLQSRPLRVRFGSLVLIDAIKPRCGGQTTAEARDRCR